MGVDIEKDCFPCKVVGSGGAFLGSIYIFYETQKFQSKIGKVVGGSASLGMLTSDCFTILVFTVLVFVSSFSFLLHSIYLSATWLPHDQVEAFAKGIVSLLQC